MFRGLARFARPATVLRAARMHTSRLLAQEAKTTLLEVLEERKLVQAVTSRALREHLATRDANGKLVTRTVYAGIDPSAVSLHVGNLLPLLALLHCALHGHTALVLVRCRV